MIYKARSEIIISGFFVVISHSCRGTPCGYPKQRLRACPYTCREHGVKLLETSLTDDLQDDPRDDVEEYN